MEATAVIMADAQIQSRKTGEYNGLHCPACGSPSVPVCYGVHDRETAAKWRKRKCRDCGAKFWTKEEILGVERTPPE
jgi:hypothetical protein